MSIVQLATCITHIIVDINDQDEMVTSDNNPNVIPTGKTSKSIEIMAHK